MRNKVSWVKIELGHNTCPKGDHIPHEKKYNTGHGISAIPHAVCREIRCEPRQSEIQQNSFLYLLLEKRWDGSVASLRCQSRRPHSHPKQHTEAELKLIRDMRRRNPKLGMIELWHRLRKCGYARRPESLFRVMRRLGLFPAKKPKKPYKPKRACEKNSVNKILL